MEKKYWQAIGVGCFFGYLYILYSTGEMFYFFTGLVIVLFTIFES
jgi:hypothetical protein